MSPCQNCGFSGKPNTTRANPRQQLADLESEITRVEALLRQLEQKRIPLKQEINRCHAPIFQFPPEITSEFFVDYLAANHDFWNSPLRFVSPLLLGKVCHSWRQLAWSTPALWSSMKLNLDLRIDPAMIEQWLVRSNRMPLSIYAFFSIDEQLEFPHVREALEVIAQYSMQWAHIVFHLPRICYTILNDRMGPLHSLNLYPLTPLDTTGHHIIQN